ncbi:TerB family tellurite resistance protein [bacterium]|nr:TerB family tellurite resistance protein [bacterium]
MKFFISILFFILSLSINTNAQEESKNFEKEVKDYIEGKTDIKPKFLKTDNAINDKKIQEMLDKADRLRNPNNSSNNTTDFLQKLKPFIIPLIIVLYLISKSNDGNKEKPQTNTKSKNSHNRNEEFIKKHNETDDEYNNEWNYDDNEEQFDSIKISIKEQIYENTQMFDIEAKGPLNFTKEQIEQSEKENKEAKFSCYVFDITDKDNKTPLQGLTDPYKDENYLLSSTRNMKVGLGLAYNDWTAMFRFPKSIIIPPNRGQRILKFVVCASKIKSKFDQGKIKNKKDLYFETTKIFNLDYEQPGYLESEIYESALNEKIVQLGMAVAYSEKKINTSGVEAIKSWINTEILWKNYLTDETEEKVKYSFLLKNTHELLKKNKLSLSEIVKEINFKSNISRRYDAMNLLLNIAGSDDRLSKEEDKLLNNTARALELDLDRFQQMKTSTIANIDTIDESDEDNEDTIFNFSKDMTDADKCKKLREEYTRWNRQTNNSNEKIRNQARKMVELTANLRKKYNC